MHPANVSGALELKVSIAEVEGLDFPKTITVNTVLLQREHQSLRSRNMDEHDSNAPRGHDNTAIRSRLPDMPEETQHSDSEVDSVFLTQISSSSLSVTGGHISQMPLSSETILFTRFKRFSFIWNRSWIGFVVDPCVLDIVNVYSEDFHDNSSLMYVTLVEFVSV